MRDTTESKRTEETPIIENERIVHKHPIFNRFEQVGWEREQLVDPADLQPGTIREEQVVRVEWEAGRGPVEHSVEATSLTEEVTYEPATHAVEFADERFQPINFPGALNDTIPAIELFDSRDHARVTVFAVGQRSEIPAFSKQEAVKFLEPLKESTTLRRPVVEALCQAVDAEANFPYEEDGHGEFIEAHFILPTLARAATGKSRQSDSEISGKKKINRQQFTRNLKLLRDSVSLSPVGGDR
jgi:hypothetical protein